MMKPPTSISYKDPAGYIIRQKEGFYRIITEAYKDEYEHLMLSGLYKELTEQSLLLSHQEMKGTDQEIVYYKLLFPDQINTMVYPYEWTYSQWHQMALTYLRINKIALQYGMILKDATPYNFVFRGADCLLLDTISFRFFQEGDNWLAYRPFCEEILSPLALMHYKETLWVRLYRTMINGIPLSFVSKELPINSWFNLNCLLHIHWHAKFQQQTHQLNKQTGFSKEKLLALFDMMEKNLHKWKFPLTRKSIWDHYYEKDIEDEKYLIHKTNIIQQWLAEIRPDTTIDLGANTGKFSFLAADHSSRVIAVEQDIFCVEEIRKTIVEKKIKNITSIVADIAEPSPGLGWANEEKNSLLERLKGDMVMSLALIHHLCLSRNIPLHFIAKLFSNLSSRYLIVEFIPKTDPKAMILLQNKKDSFKHYSEDELINSFSVYFKLIQVQDCEASTRKMYLWEKK